jgi:hypothetical protein
LVARGWRLGGSLALPRSGNIRLDSGLTVLQAVQDDQLFKLVEHDQQPEGNR